MWKDIFPTNNFSLYYRQKVKRRKSEEQGILQNPILKEKIFRMERNYYDLQMKIQNNMAHSK